MKLAKIKDNSVETIGEDRTLFPNTSFPKSGPDADWLATNSCAEVITFMSFDSATQKNESVTPYLSDGKVYTHRVTDMTSEEVAALVVTNTAQTAARTRTRRDALLSETDWVVTKAAEAGSAVAENWKTYRQALRDITTHGNWPNLASPLPDGSGDNDWPVKPS